MRPAAAQKMQDPGNTGDSRSVREQILATTRALVAAEEAYLRGGVASVRWERRGLLGRLVRS